MKILPLPEIHIGKESLDMLIPSLERVSAGRVLVVTDPGIVTAGIYDEIKIILDGAKLDIVLFDQVEPDPGIRLVEELVEIARSKKVDAVIALGGGSSIDAAKVSAALVENEGSVRDYIGIDLLKRPGLPTIVLPTTAGTGSEVTPVAVLSDEDERLKKGIASPKLIPTVALLNPAFTVKMPPSVTAFTGMDALIHALEAFISVNASDFSDAVALKAVRLISENIRTAFTDGEDRTAREAMLLGSLMAGIAFANAGVAAVHAFAYPLGGIFHIPHGLANSVMLPVIMEYNMAGNEKKYIELARAMTGEFTDDIGPKSAVAFINTLSDDLAIPRNLKALDIPESAVEEMAAGAMQVTRLLVNNPRKIDLDDAIRIYTDVYHR
jgi:alcohol dehydrogenase class IV